MNYNPTLDTLMDMFSDTNSLVLETAATLFDAATMGVKFSESLVMTKEDTLYTFTSLFLASRVALTGRADA